MPGGRPPKPTAVHVLNGNPSKKNLNTGEPKPLVAAPEMPRGMSRAANREWKQIVPILLGMGVLTIVDGKALSAYCESYAGWEESRKHIKKFGRVFVTHFEDKEGNLIVGDMKANPAVAQEQAYLKAMNTFLAQFGLSPSTRAKVKGEKPEVQDPMEAFLDGPAAEATPMMPHDKKPN